MTAQGENILAYLNRAISEAEQFGLLLRTNADRKLIAEHQPDGTGGCVTCARPEESEEDSEGNSVSFRTAIPHPCPTLRLLAQGYGRTEDER